jgi:hypothetical protein
MAAGKKKVVFRASVRGARRAGRSITWTGRKIQTEIIRAFADLGLDATKIYRAFAPHASGRLERGLKAHVRSFGGRVRVEIESTAVSKAGYPYTDVTRRGHRKRWIYPVTAKALRFPINGRIGFFKRVRGYRPARDWTEPAAAAVDRKVDQVAGRIGRVIDSGAV